MEGKTLRNCSTSKDAEADHDPLQKAKRELENLESDPMKKQKTCQENSEDKDNVFVMTKKDEEHDCCMEVLEEDTIMDCSKSEMDTKSDPMMTCEEKSENKEDSLEPKSNTSSEDKEWPELRKSLSFKAMTDVWKILQSKSNTSSEDKEWPERRKSLSFKAMTDVWKILQESIMSKAHMRPVISFMEKKTPEKEEEHDCCSESHVLEGLPNSETTILVKGFDDSLPRGDIRSALWEHFSSCGVVTRVFVPFVCKTGASVGFAFVDLEMDSEKAVTLNGSLLKGWTLEVKMAITTPEYRDWRNSFRGCRRCTRVLLEKRRIYDALDSRRRMYSKIRIRGGGVPTFS